MAATASKTTAKPAATKSASKPSRATAAKPASAKPRAAAKVAAKPAARSTKSRPAKPRTASRAKAAPKASSQAAHVDRVWKLAKRIGICMFVTWDGERQRARPLAASVRRDEHAIYFLADVDGQKDDQIARFPIVTLGFADTARAKYVSITGKATVDASRARIKDLWSPFAKAWWDSPEDPNIRVIRVEPQDAELWDSPGRIATTVAMLAAAVTGKSPKVGENAKVTL